MKKILLAAGLSLAVFTTSFAEESVADYMVNDQKVEQLFTESLDMSLSVATQQIMPEQNAEMLASGAASFKSSKSDKSAGLAILLDLFLGGLGIHIIYLGTETFTWIGYILTCGGIGGIVPFIDLIVLIVHAGDVSEYVDNPKFFMW